MKCGKLFTPHILSNIKIKKLSVITIEIFTT
jgi:hypothetical protein